MGLLETVREGDQIQRQLKVSKELMSGFCDLSGDSNPLHVNDGFAKSKGFSGRVAYGNMLNLMISALVGMDLKDDNVMLFYQEIQYKKPVYINDLITAIGTISNISTSVGVIEIKLKFRNQADTLVAKGSCSLKCI